MAGACIFNPRRIHCIASVLCSIVILTKVVVGLWARSRWASAAWIDASVAAPYLAWLGERRLKLPGWVLGGHKQTSCGWAAMGGDGCILLAVPKLQGTTEVSGVSQASGLCWLLHGAGRGLLCLPSCCYRGQGGFLSL